MDHRPLGPLVHRKHGRNPHRAGAGRVLIRRGPGLHRTGRPQGPPLRHDRRRARGLDDCSAPCRSRARGLPPPMSADWLEIRDERFRPLALPNAPPEVLGEGFRWLEAPVWFADHDVLLFSDIPNDRIVRWSESGGLSTFRAPSGFANGKCRDRAGRLVLGSHQHRWIERTELDGRRTVLAERYEGPRL